MDNNNNNLVNKLNGVSKSFHYNLPQEVRDLLAQAASTISDSSSSGDTFARHDGTVNCDNPIVAAALTDSMGQLMLATIHELNAHPEIPLPDAAVSNINTIFRTLQMFRNNIRPDMDELRDNQSHLIPQIMEECRVKADSAMRSKAEELGIPIDVLRIMFPNIRPSAAEVADSIFDDLVNDGVIGRISDSDSAE